MKFTFKKFSDLLQFCFKMSAQSAHMGRQELRNWAGRISDELKSTSLFSKVTELFGPGACLLKSAQMICGRAEKVLEFLEKPYKICKADTGAMKIQFTIRNYDYDGRIGRCSFFFLNKECPHEPLYMIIIDFDDCSVYDMQNSRDLLKFKFPFLHMVPTYKIWLTWYNDVIEMGSLHFKPFMSCPLNTESEKKQIIGFIKFITIHEDSEIVDWDILSMGSNYSVPSPLNSMEVPKRVDGGKLRWVKMVKGDELPMDAMIGGFEKETLYIARAHHMRSMVPGKYVKSEQCAFIPWGHQEHAKNVFEVLCGYDATWVQCTSNRIPENAFIGGRSEVRNEPLYIGRVRIENYIIPGKVHQLYRSCYIPFNGRESSYSRYEILVSSSKEPHGRPCDPFCYMKMNTQPCLTEG